MTDSRIRIALAQAHQRMGDIGANATAMLAWRERAAAEGADLIVFPELQLIGYPPEDLVLNPALVERAELELIRLAEATADGGPAMLVGTVFEAGGLLFNCLALLDEGTIVAVSQKRELPNYGCFDEKRLFAPGPLPGVLPFRGVQLGLAVGEDLSFPFVAGHLKAAGAEILVAVTASPYEAGKDDRRRSGVAAARVKETGLPILYVNRVGGQDDLVFDGGSFVMNGEMSGGGGLACRLPEWEEALLVTTWERGAAGGWRCQPALVAEPEAHPADIYSAMLVALRDHVEDNGFAGVLIGLTGDVASALSAAVAVDALGPERVWCVAMESGAGAEDAAEGARLLGIRFDTVPTGEAMAAFEAMLAPLSEGLATGAGNESLVRAATLKSLAERSGHMLLATANKSALSVGHGDGAGGYSVVKDAYTTTVLELARWRNADRPAFGLGPDGPVMPQQLIAHAPGPDGLPPPALLDAILHALIEEDKPVEAVAALGFDRATVAHIEDLLHAAEGQRRQSSPGVKLTGRAFGRDRRYPITNAFRTA